MKSCKANRRHTTLTHSPTTSIKLEAEWGLFFLFQYPDTRDVIDDPTNNEGCSVRNLVMTQKLAVELTQNIPHNCNSSQLVCGISVSSRMKCCASGYCSEFSYIWQIEKVRYTGRRRCSGSVFCGNLPELLLYIWIYGRYAEQLVIWKNWWH